MRRKRIIIIYLVGLIIILSSGSFILGDSQNSENTNKNIDLSICQSNIKCPKMNKSFFTENKGQWNPDILFLATTSFGQIGLGKECVCYNLRKIPEVSIKNYSIRERGPIREKQKGLELKGHVLKLSFEDVKDVRPIGLEPLNYKNNYFYGNNFEKWATGVKNFRKILYKDLWDGIDIVYYFNKHGLKYEFIIHSQSNPNKIRIRVEGHTSLEKTDSYLMINTPLGIPIKDGDLNIFYGDNIRKGESITGTFKILTENTFSFELEKYDQNRKIVIDPLVYSTFMGSNGDEYGYAIEVDDNRNAYVMGITTSSDFPTTPGAYDTSYNDIEGGYDTYVLKLNPSGSDLLFSTYIGGSELDEGKDMTIDSKGNVYVTGTTVSSDFPITDGAFDNTHSDGWDGFVFKLNADGSSLIYSTYFGSGFDNGAGITIDNNKNAYVTGNTRSIDFPTTTNAYDTSYNEGEDAFVFKLSHNGSEMIFSTYIGGMNMDYGKGITVDQTGNVFVTGTTLSATFPTTPNAYDTTYNGVNDCFVLKLDPTGSELIYSTFIGGTLNDNSEGGIVIDSDENIYITGDTYSLNFPTTEGAFDTSINEGLGVSDIFILKLDSNGSDIIYSTYVGGLDTDWSYAITIDSAECVYVTGMTSSSDFPITEEAYDTTWNDLEDVFMLKLNSDGSELIYSTFVGGVSTDEGYDISLDSREDVYVTGITFSQDFPNTSNAYDISYDDLRDAFILKLNISQSSAPPGTDPPSPPENLQAHAGDEYVNLTWLVPYNDGGSEIKEYRIYRGTSSGNENYYNSVDAFTNYYNDIEVTNDRTYYYFVTAVNLVGESEPSNKVSATLKIELLKPSAPENLRANEGDGYVKLSWRVPNYDGGTSIIEYKIYRGISSSNKKVIDSVTSSTTSYQDDTVTNGKTYYYHITAVNDVGESEPSNEVTVIPQTFEVSDDVKKPVFPNIITIMGVIILLIIIIFGIIIMYLLSKRKSTPNLHLK